MAEAHAQRQRVESGGGAGARALAEAEAQLRVLRKKQYEGNRRVTVTRALWLPLLARCVSLCLTLRMFTRTRTQVLESENKQLQRRNVALQADIDKLKRDKTSAARKRVRLHGWLCLQYHRSANRPLCIRQATNQLEFIALRKAYNKYV